MKSIITYINESSNKFDKLVNELTNTVDYNEAVNIIKEHFSNSDEKISDSEIKKRFLGQKPDKIRHGEQAEENGDIIEFLMDKDLLYPGEGEYSIEAEAEDCVYTADVIKYEGYTIINLAEDLGDDYSILLIF